MRIGKSEGDIAGNRDALAEGRESPPPLRGRVREGGKMKVPAVAFPPLRLSPARGERARRSYDLRQLTTIRRKRARLSNLLRQVRMLFRLHQAEMPRRKLDKRVAPHQSKKRQGR